MADNNGNNVLDCVNEGAFKVNDCKIEVQGEVRQDPVEAKVVTDADTECMGSGYVPEKSEAAVICLDATTCEPLTVSQPDSTCEPPDLCKPAKPATTFEMVSKPETSIDGPATLEPATKVESKSMCKAMTEELDPVPVTSDEPEYGIAETEQGIAELGQVTVTPCEPEPITNKPESAKSKDLPSHVSEKAMNDSSGKRKAITENAGKANVKRMAMTEDADKANPEATDDRDSD